MRGLGLTFSFNEFGLSSHETHYQSPESWLQNLPLQSEDTIGRSVRRSSARHSAVPFGQSTADNDVVATIRISLFFSLFFSSPLLPFLTEGVLQNKNPLFLEEIASLVGTHSVIH